MKKYLLCILLLFFIYNCNDYRQQNKINKINKFTFIIHPYCWLVYNSVPDGYDPILWNRNLDRERKLHKKHIEYINNMGDDEVLIILPSQSTPEMNLLIRIAKEKLGNRVYIENLGGHNASFLKKYEKKMFTGEGGYTPFEAFIFEKNLIGKKEFVEYFITNAYQNEYDYEYAKKIEDEIHNLVTSKKIKWKYDTLEVIYYSATVAKNVKKHLKNNNYIFDNETTMSVAFGEGFDQCAMTWKSMVVHWMDLKNPIENNYELSVAGCDFLLDFNFIETIKMNKNTRAFLWRNEQQNSNIVFFMSPEFNIKRNQQYAYLSIKNIDIDNNIIFRSTIPELDICIQYSKNTLLYSGQIYLTPENKLRIPVFVGSRKGCYDYPIYTIVKNMQYENFKSKILNTKISENQNDTSVIGGGDWWVN